ncbi:nitroreductase family protein [Weissella diestrammenae]|uniref:Nitroreductase family protein n=1 Tax=Weissella diestrammenae TaxID=1162633 RepID=A0A7G9T4E9_9LACO|nr:nitroreductase family protein [Weissella diestrammenae]MCM0583510.1 nitroreductase family protein [Weissella diestrammenae]QNN74974.1 nitroreductase family protein [Weissella diestrammenae]
MTLAENFLNLEAKRRSIYALGKQVTVGDDQLVSLIETAIKEAPTSFNNQTVRAVILFGEKHDQAWDLVADRLKSEVPDEAAWEATQNKVNGFKAGYATVLFYTDTDVVKQFENDFALYADNFYDWSEQGHGIATYATWLAITEAGLGGTIQHYNPLIDDSFAQAFDIPSNWRLRSQFVIGSIEAPAGEKTYLADDDRFKVLK